jgi:hypothetical protein
MSVIQSADVGGTTSGTSYSIPKSLRFRSSASAYLSRTPGVAGNRKTWTWSGWVKRGSLTNANLFWAAPGTPDNDYTRIRIASDALVLESYISAATQFIKTSTALLRDPSAWYHIVGIVDTDNATAADRVKL